MGVTEVPTAEQEYYDAAAAAGRGDASTAHIYFKVPLASCSALQRNSSPELLQLQMRARAYAVVQSGAVASDQSPASCTLWCTVACTD